MTTLPGRIISGGQTGVDRAALDFAIERGIPWGGWAPKGWRAEGGVIPERYRANMRECPTAGYGPRTVLNMRDCTSLIVFTDSRRKMSTVTRLTIDLAYGASRDEDGRPFYEFDLNAEGYCTPQLLRWIGGAIWDDRRADLRVLNIAGPRESKAPGIYQATLNLLRAVWPR